MSLSDKEKAFVDELRFDNNLATALIWVCRQTKIDPPTRKQLTAIDGEVHKHLLKDGQF